VQEGGAVMNARAMVWVAVAVFGAGAALCARAEDRPPNIVVILADDLGYGDIGPYGNTLIKTPRLEKMAAEGALLTNFYSSGNICTPSRGGLLTGRYPARLGLASNDVARATNQLGLAGSEVTIAAALKPRGYATACIGKWHLGQQPEQWPTAHGFDYFYGLPYSNDMLPLALYRMSEAIEEPVDQTTLTERYTDEAVKFIEAHQAAPFFVYLAHTMPHVPLFVSKKFAGKSAAGLYGDVIETIDWSVGQVLDTLQRLGLDDSTLVIFTSDNGPWWEGSAGAYRDRKGSAWDGGMRVPMIARWPGRIAPGTRSSAIAMNIDFFPTFAKLAGAQAPSDRPIDGRDLWPLLQGRGESPHEYLYLFDADKIAAVRSQRWKLVVQSFYRQVNAQIGAKSYFYYPGLLFDMEQSPAEVYSYTREHPDIAAQLSGWIEAGRAELEAQKKSP
jgi:uncharacterized sulfatase